MDKLYCNTVKIYKVFNLINQQQQQQYSYSSSSSTFKAGNNTNSNNSNDNSKGFDNTEAVCSLVIFFLSNFKFKLQQGVIYNNDSSAVDKLIGYLNYMLTMANSKFLLHKALTKEEFISITLYLLYEYDIPAAFVDHLKKFESKHLSVSLQLLLKSISFDHTKNINNESSDVLGSIVNNKPCQSTIESFNKLNFVLKNIKKQLDLFVNLTYKLKELKRTQEKPKASLKVEEIILVTNDVFESYYDSFQLTKEILMYHLESFPTLIDLIDTSYEQYHNLHSMITIGITNPLYDENNKNVKIITLKQVFTIKILLEAQGNNHSIMVRLSNWIQKLDNMLSNNLALLKQKNPAVFNNENVTKTLETIAGELENFIEGNEKNISKLMSSFEEGNNNNYNLIKSLANSNKESIEEVYDNFLITNDGLEELYNYYKDNINNQIQEETINLSKKYSIMNNTP